MHVSLSTAAGHVFVCVIIIIIIITGCLYRCQEQPKSHWDAKTGSANFCFDSVDSLRLENKFRILINEKREKKPLCPPAYSIPNNGNQVQSWDQPQKINVIKHKHHLNISMNCIHIFVFLNSYVTPTKPFLSKSAPLHLLHLIESICMVYLRTLHRLI